MRTKQPGRGSVDYSIAVTGVRRVKAFMARRESEDIRGMVAAVLRCIPPTPEAAQGPVYVAARRGGIKLWETWSEATPWDAGLGTVLQNPPPPRRGDDAPDAFEVCLTQLPQPVDPRRR